MKIFNVPAGRTKGNSIYCIAGNVFERILRLVHDVANYNAKSCPAYVHIAYRSEQFAE